MKKVSWIAVSAVIFSFTAGVYVGSGRSFSAKAVHADGGGLIKVHKIGSDLQSGLATKDQVKLRACMETKFCQSYERMNGRSNFKNVVYHQGSARLLGTGTATFLIESERNGITALSRVTLKKKNGVWKVCAIR